MNPNEQEKNIEKERDDIKEGHKTRKIEDKRKAKNPKILFIMEI